MAEFNMSTEKSICKTKPVSESRKIRKPLMERKRRERINSSLNQLAALLTDANMVKPEAGKQNKLEKADILELTVKHLQNITSNKENENYKQQKNQPQRFQQGFAQCMNIVEHMLKSSTNEKLRERLLRHLQCRLKTLQCPTSQEQDLKKSLVVMEETDTLNSKRNHITKPLEELTPLTLVPTELPGGEVAFLLKGDPKRLFPHLQIASLLTSNNSTAIPIDKNRSNVVSSNSPPHCSTSTAEQSFQIDSSSLTPSDNQDALPSFKNSNIGDEESQPSSSNAPIPNVGFLQPKKTPCLLTPPPSPPFPPGLPKSTDSSQNLPKFNDRVQYIDNRRREVYMEPIFHEPFDLSLAKLWRPF